jgi:iron complex transport system ATP-binding protein
MTSVIEFDDVSVTREGTAILSHVAWQVLDDQRWVVLGPNGAGKTTLLQVAAALMHPS